MAGSPRPLRFKAMPRAHARMIGLRMIWIAASRPRAAAPAPCADSATTLNTFTSGITRAMATAARVTPALS